MWSSTLGTDTTTMVSQYRTPPFFLRKSRFFGHRDFFPSPRPIYTFTAKNGIRQILNYRANCDVGGFFLNVGVKIRRNWPTCFFSSRPPDRPFWTPFFGGKMCQPCIPVYLKTETFRPDPESPDLGCPDRAAFFVVTTWESEEGFPSFL